MTGRLMLEHKGIGYRRVDLLPALHKPILRALGFRAGTVPALRIDRRRLQNTLELSRALDELQPEPPLFPADASQNAAVQTAERWGEEVLQPVPRRLAWWGVQHDKSQSGLRTMGEGSRTHVPVELMVRTAAPFVWAEVRLNRATDAAVQADLAALPRMLDRVKAWRDAGVLGGRLLNAADYQIATSIRLLLCFDDLRDQVDNSLAAYARHVVPDFPGHIAAVFPHGWITSTD